MKRIVFSIYTDTVEPHQSATDFKKNQLKLFKNKLEESQSNYAKSCAAEYNLFTTSTTNYDHIQFEKLILLDDLSKDYDEVLYLDFDVIPNTPVNFFEAWDLNHICYYSVNRSDDRLKVAKMLKYQSYDKMNMFVKLCAKKAMLLLDDINGNDDIANTGVVAGNKESIQKLDFKNRLNELHEKFNEAVDDNVYPDDITKLWFQNNEVYISYLVERYQVPYQNIGLPWNFLIDRNHPEVSAAGHFLHHVNKEFQRSYGDL